MWRDDSSGGCALQRAQQLYRRPDIAALKQPDSGNSAGAGLETVAGIRGIHSTERQYGKATRHSRRTRFAQRVQANAFRANWYFLEDRREHSEVRAFGLGALHIP